MSKLVIGVLAATLALAACGSSSKSGSAGGGSSTTVGGGSGGSSGDEISGLVAKSKTAAYKVTYKTSDGETITVAQDGSGQQSVVRGNDLYITDGSTTIHCDGTTSSATCQDLGVAGKAAASTLTGTLNQTYSALEAMSSGLFNGHTSSDTIAGRDATCVTVKLSDMEGVFGAIASKLSINGSATTCLDKETGVLLKIAGGPGDEQTDLAVATDFSQPSGSDFQPPSTPQSAPSFTVPTIPDITIPSG